MRISVVALSVTLCTMDYISGDVTERSQKVFLALLTAVILAQSYPTQPQLVLPPDKLP